jgi:hypothetical protein
MAATKKGKSMFVPNSFQTPNDYVDNVMPHLTGEEFKVLVYAVRRILGFQKRQDRIALSQFTDGTKSKDGETLDSGTGLSNETVKKCLANLVSFNLMIRVAENDPKTNDGILWELQWDETKVNWAALEERDEKKRKIYKKKMKKARSMRHTPPNGIEPTPPNGIEGGGANGIETQKTVETQGNTDGTNVPTLSIENQIFLGVQTVVIPDETQAKRIDAANLISMGCGVNTKVAFDMAMAFQNERGITFTESDIKGQRKAIKSLLEKQVKPSHVAEAVRKLSAAKMTFVDLFGIIKTAVDIASQPQPEPTRLL